MRVLVIALILITVSSCLAVNRKVLLDAHDRQALQCDLGLVEDDNNVKVEYPPDDVNNHHYIPRSDFNPHEGDGGN